MQKRCSWVSDEKIYIDYHDQEWGVPVYDDKNLFAMLNLEGQQAGLSWITVLKKREDYYKIFKNFDPELISKFSDGKIEKILQDPKIIRNRLKVNSIVINAKAYINFQKNSSVSFSEFIWGFVGNKTKINSWSEQNPQPASTQEAEQMSKALKKLGFKFVGPTICYAFMQAVGMVNDHDVECFKKAK